MILPYPEDMAENRKLARVGTTWLRINVNQVLPSSRFTNWRPQRGHLEADGGWVSEVGSNLKDFF